MNSRPLRPERSALPSALYPVEKRQRTLPYGCGRRIRTLTMRVRVAGATITQFRIKLLYYYTKNRACCQYPFERNFTRAKEILHREGLWQKSFAAFRAGRGIPSGARHSERGAAFRAGRGIPGGARHSGQGAAFRAGRGIPGKARHLREEPLLHWTHSPLQNGGYSSLPKGDTAPCKMGGIAPCRRGHTAPWQHWAQGLRKRQRMCYNAYGPAAHCGKQRPGTVRTRPKQRRPGQNTGRIGGRPHAHQSGCF